MVRDKTTSNIFTKWLLKTRIQLAKESSFQVSKLINLVTWSRFLEKEYKFSRELMDL